MWHMCARPILRWDGELDHSQHAFIHSFILLSILSFIHSFIHGWVGCVMEGMLCTSSAISCMLMMFVEVVLDTNSIHQMAVMLELFFVCGDHQHIIHQIPWGALSPLDPLGLKARTPFWNSHFKVDARLWRGLVLACLLRGRVAHPLASCSSSGRLPHWPDIQTITAWHTTLATNSAIK